MLPILVKGTAVAALLGPAFAASGPLWILCVIITYSVAQEKQDRAKVNARLARNLIINLNKCRERAFKVVLANEGRERATMAKKLVDDGDKVVMRVLVDGKRVVRITRENLRVVAVIMTNRDVFMKDRNGSRVSISSEDSDVEWPLARIFIFLKAKLGAKMPRNEENAKALVLDKVDKSEIAQILKESGFEIPDEGSSDQLGELKQKKFMGK